MRTLRSAASVLILVLATCSIKAQTILSSINQTISINFDNLNTNFGDAHTASGGSSLFPTATDATGTNPTTIFTGLTFSNDDFNPGGIYSNTDSYNSSNGARALRDGSSSDLAFGLKDSTDRSITLQVQNSTGSTISQWSVSYAIEQYSQGGSATQFTLSYSLNGSSFTTTHLSGGSPFVSQTGADGNLSSVVATSMAATVSESVANGSSIYLRWTYNHDTGTSVHLGIDDISVSAIPEPSTYAAIIGGVALLGAIWHRRRKAKRAK